MAIILPNNIQGETRVVTKFLLAPQDSPRYASLTMVKLRTGIACLLILGLSAGACREIEPDVEPPRQALEGVPIVPLSVVLSEGGTEEVAQTVLYTPFSADTSASFYRSRLIAAGWDIQSDVRTPDGRTTIHAVRNGPPLWVIIQPVEGQEGATYTIMGADPDRRGLEEARARNSAD